MTSARALIREAREYIADVYDIREDAWPPDVKMVKRLADVLEARLDQQDQLQEAVRQAHGWITDALDEQGFESDDEMLQAEPPGSNVAARLISARDTLKTALGWTCDHCSTHWPHKPDLPPGTVGCPECGTFVPEEGEA